MHQIKDYINRLKNVSVQEILYRLKRLALTKYFEKILTPRNANLRFDVPHVDITSLQALKAPSVFYSGHGEASETITMPQDLHKFEHQHRNTFFSKIRCNNQAPDIRSIWEYARLQDITENLFKNNSNDYDALLDKAAERVLLWIQNNPFLHGVHYLSPMECGLRIPVFFFLLKFLKPDKHEKIIQPVLSTVYSHAWWISRNMALYSSLGNHTVCESVGLIFAGVIFEKCQEGQNWIKKGCHYLEQELPRQVLQDGGPAEQSLSYHRFVLDLYWLAVDLLESNGLHDCAGWRPRLESGEMFLSAFMDAGGSVPAIGDSDDGHAVAPGLTPRRHDPEFHAVGVKTFSESGYTVLRGAGESMLVLDHGPLGMAPLYNHGHADALSLTLSVQGKQLLVDPGTYRYNGVPLWRRYFKGTRAHNTITVDGLDQAIQETGFIWSAPYHASLVSCRAGEDNEVRLVAVHDGYRRLPQPVEHRRSLLWSPDGWLVVKDSFTGHGQHDYELNWHLHPDILLTEENGWWSARRGEAHLAICLLTGPSLRSVRGQEEPVLGWYAPAYGVKQPCTVLQSRQTGPPETVLFVTALVFTEQKPDPDMLLQAAEEL